MEIFATWRGEIAAELDAAQQQLAAATDELRQATEAADAAKAERDEVAAIVGGLGGRRQLASALAWRYRGHFADLGRPDGRVAQARELAKEAHRKIADLTEALEQLDEIAPLPESVKELTEAAE
jgi:uncharacterized coiled-coil DUF342 family protein